MLSVDIEKCLGSFHLRASFSAGDETVVLFGPSGAGKSLTLQAIAGTIQPDRGCVVVNGERLFDASRGVNLPPQRRRVGYVPQHYALFPHLTVAGNIGYGLNGVPRSQRQQQVQELVHLMGLSGLEKRLPAKLSGGQQQRVALARALAVQPQVLLLDEPFSSLDDTMRSSLQQELLEVQARRGITTVIVTHSLKETFTLGSRVVIFDDGRVLQEGSRDEVFYRPRTRRVAQFVDTGNILWGKVVSVDEAALRLEWQGHILEAPPQPLTPGSEVDFCIRSTQVMIVRPDRPPSDPPENPLCGRIVQESVAADNYTLFVRLLGSPNAHDIRIELPGYVYHRLNLDTQKEVTVSLRKHALHIMPVA